MTTPEDERAAAVRDLISPGEEYRELQARAREVRSVLRPRVERALRAGVSYRRIEELTGLSPATISAWGRELDRRE